ncbi:MAG TPA: hypothetical protein PKI75_00930, partial [Candidatus Woesebacteria bacterium]|nr:hypothetical protein [Candidatus Woesebacteria bacterium]
MSLFGDLAGLFKTTGKTEKVKTKPQSFENKPKPQPQLVNSPRAPKVDLEKLEKFEVQAREIIAEAREEAAKIREEAARTRTEIFSKEAEVDRRAGAIEEREKILRVGKEEVDRKLA